MKLLTERFLLLVVLLVAGGAPLEGASAEVSASYPSGTYRGRVLTELFRHQQERSRTSRTAALSPASAAAVREDIGNIAIIDDSDGVVLRPNSFDLNRRSLTLSRSAGGYTVDARSLSFDAAARDQSIPLSLGDDDAASVFLPFSFPFFDGVHTEVFVHSDGNLTFAETDAASTSRSLSRAISGPPRIAPLFTDLDPSRDQAQVLTFASSDRVVITWDDVPEFTFFGVGRRQTFQAVLHRDGRIEFHYESITLTSIVTGIMPGRLQGETTAVDLSEGTADPIGGALAEIFTRSTSVDSVAVTQKFYRNHSDAYDFVVLFNNMRLQPGPGSFAFELNIRNEVDGIGSPQPDGDPVFDFGVPFGSPRRLQSFVNMGPLTNYPEDPRARIPILGENTSLTVLGQEAGHRFLVYVQFLDPETGLLSRALLGRQNAHWSFFFNSDASVLEGNRIEDRGMVSPRFATVGAVEQYSALDQYLMGLRGADEVEPSFLVEDPSTPRPPSSSPATGVTFDGTRKDIPLDLIIDAEGERRPHWTVAQKDFNFAFVLLVPEGSDVPPEDIEKLERIRSEWIDFFSSATDQRVSTRAELLKLLRLSTWPAAGIVQGFPGTAAVEIDSPLQADLEVLLTADNGAITVPSVVTIPAGELRASFQVMGNDRGIANLSARVNLPGFDTAETIVQVRDGFSDLALEIESGDNQSSGEASTLPEPVVFRLRDINKLHYPGILVSFAASGDGVVTPSQAVTDESGRIAVQWRLASSGQFNTLEAEVEGASEIQARAIALSLGPQPAFSAAGVVNAASFNTATPSPEPVLAPGGLYSIFGTALALQPEPAPSLPLPRQLGGTSVSVNGTLVPLLFTSASQINFQAPFEINGSTAEIVVNALAGASGAITVPVRLAQPGVFFDAQTGTGAILNTDGTLVTENIPNSGDFVQIFATGLGRVEPPGRTGVAASASPLAVTVLEPQVRIGGEEASVVFSGLAPFFAGLYQINAQIPEVLPPGRHPLSVTAAGVESNQVFIDLQ